MDKSAHWFQQASGGNLRRSSRATKSDSLKTRTRDNLIKVVLEGAFVYPLVPGFGRYREICCWLNAARARQASIFSKENTQAKKRLARSTRACLRLIITPGIVKNRNTSPQRLARSVSSSLSMTRVTR
jgi:hypothetical protein